MIRPAQGKPGTSTTPSSPQGWGRGLDKTDGGPSGIAAKTYLTRIFHTWNLDG